MGHTLTTSTGGWSSCGEAITGYQYEWLRNGVAISGHNSSSYTVQTGNSDVGATLKSGVAACNIDGCYGSYVQSSNSIVPADRPPNAPSSLSPVNGAVTGTTPTLSSIFSDPDGQTGYVSYSVYRNSNGARVATGSGPWVSSGSASAWTTPSLGGGLYYWYAQAGDYSGESSSSVGPTFLDVPPPTPTLVSPVSSASLATATPVLSASASDSEPIYYEFQVASDSSFQNVVADSGWVSNTSTWTVTPGALQDGVTYYWRAAAADYYGGGSNWSGVNSFTVSLPKLGVNSDWPVWSHGPVSVNEANGNLVLSLPTPSYPTTTGSLTFSLTYNSQAASGSAGLGAGWTLVAGDGSMSPPLKLVDHTVVSPIQAAAEIDWPDGSSDFYSRVGSSTTYLSGAGDGSQLTKNPDGTWSLLDSDSTMYTFGTEASGVSLLTGAQTAATATGHGILSYSFNASGEITSLAFQDTTTSQASETLTFTWGGANCSALLCVTGPDTRTWTYTAADPNNANKITGVSDGTRQLFALSYTNGRVSKIQDANDLDPSHASPNYNSNHSLTISYDANSPARVSSVSDGPVTNQTPSTSTWSFSYHPGTIEPTPPRTSHYGYVVRNAAPNAYYPLDETSGTTAADASGNSNNGTYSGSYTQGEPGALAGSGGGNAVTFSGGTISGSVSKLDLSPGGYNTVEMWVDWNGADNEMPLSFGTSGIYDLWMRNGYFGFNTGHGDLYGTTALTPNIWHYVVAEFYNGASSNSKLWIDGAPRALSQRIGSASSATVAAGFNISGDYADAYQFTGGIDEVAIYGYALSPAQIAAHMAEGLHDPAPVAYYRLDETSGTTANDATGNGNTGTYSGSYTLGKNPAYGGAGAAVLFGGGTVAASVPNLNTAAGGYNTVELWVNWNGASSEMPFGFGSNYDLYFANGNFGFNTGAGDLYGTTAPSANTWHYVVAEFYNGLPQNGGKLWIDGVQKTLSIKQGTPGSKTASSNFDISGWPHDGNDRMGGEIDEVAIYNTALTPAQITLHWTRNSQGARNGADAGYTTLTPPNQQGQSCPPHCETSYYDSLGRSIESVDILGHTSESNYNANSQPLWSEDADGNPTDYLYGDPNGQPTGNPTLAGTLLQTIGPDPDGAGPLTRPVATSRYDEQTIGTQNQAGTPLTGLAGSYWNSGMNLAGLPTVRENDPAPGSSPTSFSLPVSGGNWPVSGDSSARWTGDITIPSGGDYTLSTVSDGGTRLTIDGTDAVESWTIPNGSPFTASSAPVHLSPGTHQLVLSYEHSHSEAASPTITLDWSCSDCSPAISTEAVPLDDLAPAWLNQTSTVSPAGSVSFSHYADPTLGEPDYALVQVGGSNLITSYSHDAYGRTTQTVMPKGNAGRTIDSQGNLQGTPDTTYATTSTYYGPGDTAQPPNAPDCSGSPVDQYEQLKQTATYGDAATTFVYDAAGNTIAKTNGAGTTCSTYDNENRLSSSQVPGDSQPTTYTYDPTGAQLTATGSTGTDTTYYDEQGRLVDETDSNGAEAAYSYDSDGNQISRTAAKGSLSGNPNYPTSYSYNAADQLTSETDPANNAYSFYYDSRGNLRGTQYPNGTFSWIDTNPDGWISDQYNRHGTINASTTTPPTDSTPLADYAYTYNLDGKRQTETRTSGSTNQTTSYSYDNLGRLNQVVLPSGTCRDYSYDLDSNRSQIQEAPSGCNGSFTTTATYTYDPATTQGVDELTKIAAGGNTTNYAYTSDGQTSSQGTSAFTWDGWSRIKTAAVGSNTVTYTYDPTGALKTRSSSSPSSTLNYLLGDLFETNASNTITTSYTDGPVGNLASYNGPPTSSSAPTYLYYDAHGTLAAEGDQSGSRTGDHTYDPFGAPTDTVPTNTTVHRFVGRWNKQYDTTTGLMLMGARPYDPTTGRFLSVDPIPGGSLNNYDYAGQDPINGYDLAGTSTCGGHCGGGNAAPCFMGTYGWCISDTAVDALPTRDVVMYLAPLALPGIGEEADAALASGRGSLLKVIATERANVARMANDMAKGLSPSKQAMWIAVHVLTPEAKRIARTAGRKVAAAFWREAYRILTRR